MCGLGLLTWMLSNQPTRPQSRLKTCFFCPPARRSTHQPGCWESLHNSPFFQGTPSRKQISCCWGWGKQAHKQANPICTLGKEPRMCGNKWKMWLQTLPEPEFHLFVSARVACYLYFLPGDGQGLKSASRAENKCSLPRWMYAPRSTKHIMCPR